MEELLAEDTQNNQLYGWATESELEEWSEDEGTKQLRKKPLYKLHRLARTNGTYPKRYDVLCNQSAENTSGQSISLTSTTNGLRFICYPNGLVRILRLQEIAPASSLSKVWFTPQNYTIKCREPRSLQYTYPYGVDDVVILARLLLFPDTDGTASISISYSSLGTFPARLAADSEGFSAYFPPGTLTIEPMQTGTADQQQPQENAYHQNEVWQQQHGVPPPENTGTGYGVQDNVGGDGGN